MSHDNPVGSFAGQNSIECGVDPAGEFPFGLRSRDTVAVVQTITNRWWRQEGQRPRGSTLGVAVALFP